MGVSRDRIPQMLGKASAQFDCRDTKRELWLTIESCFFFPQNTSLWWEIRSPVRLKTFLDRSAQLCRIPPGLNQSPRCENCDDSPTKILHLLGNAAENFYVHFTKLWQQKYKCTRNPRNKCVSILVFINHLQTILMKLTKIFLIWVTLHSLLLPQFFLYNQRKCLPVNRSLKKFC